LVAIFYLLTGAIVMLLYVRFERQEETVLKELENRRKSM
jgi:hypothetical protein